MRIYDYSSGEITKEYPIDSEAYIYNAMPYNDGILFSTYGKLEEKNFYGRFSIFQKRD